MTVTVTFPKGAVACSISADGALSMNTKGFIDVATSQDLIALIQHMQGFQAAHSATSISIG